MNKTFIILFLLLTLSFLICNTTDASFRKPQCHEKTKEELTEKADIVIKGKEIELNCKCTVYDRYNLTCIKKVISNDTNQKTYKINVKLPLDHRCNKNMNFKERKSQEEINYFYFNKHLFYYTQIPTRECK